MHLTKTGSCFSYDDELSLWNIDEDSSPAEYEIRPCRRSEKYQVKLSDLKYVF